MTKAFPAVPYLAIYITILDQKEDSSGSIQSGCSSPSATTTRSSVTGFTETERKVQPEHRHIRFKAHFTRSNAMVMPILVDHQYIQGNVAIQKAVLKDVAQSWFFRSLIAFRILFLLLGKASLSSFSRIVRSAALPKSGFPMSVNSTFSLALSNASLPSTASIR